MTEILLLVAPFVVAVVIALGEAKMIKTFLGGCDE